MEKYHLLIRGFVWLVHMHFSVEFVFNNQLVGHLDSEGLHWVIFSVVEAANVGYKSKVSFISFYLQS